MGISFDFDSVRNRLINRLKSKSSWANILLYSTNMRLIDAIAEEISALANYDTFLTNENKWSNAINRSSLVSMAKLIGYEPRRRISSRGFLRVSADKNFNAAHPINIEIPKHTIFSTEGGIKFVSTKAYTLTNLDNYIDIEIIQGNIIEINFISLGVINEEYFIQSDKIENDYVKVFVNEGEWLKVDNLMECGKDDKVFVVENKPDLSGVYIKFGDDRFGKSLEPGWIVKIQYLESDAYEGNVLSQNMINKTLSLIKDLNGNIVNLYCKNIESISGGRDADSVEEIRNFAPRIFQTGGRNSTLDDYLINLQSFSFVSKVNVWGVEESNKDKGLPIWTFVPSEENVVHCAVLNDLYENLTDQQKVLIIEALQKKKSPTDIISFEEVDIIKFFFEINGYVNNRGYSLVNVKNNILNALDCYLIQNMDFNKNIYFSDYQALIDNVEGIDHHSTVLKFLKISYFNRFYVSDYSLSLKKITRGSIFIYYKKGNDNFVLLCKDDGLGGFDSLVSGVDVSLSSVDYNNGKIVLSVSGLTENYNLYTLKTIFKIDSNEMILPNRKSIFSIDKNSVNISLQYI